MPLQDQVPLKVRQSGPHNAADREARRQRRRDSAAMAGRHPSNLERQVVLTTRSIVVTTWLPDDVEDLHELHPDPLTMRFTGPWRPESRRVRCPFYVYAYESQL